MNNTNNKLIELRNESSMTLAMQTRKVNSGAPTAFVMPEAH